jgi:hypothetical protein
MTGRNYYNCDKSSVPGPGQYNNNLSNMHKNPTWRYKVYNLESVHLLEMMI